MKYEYMKEYPCNGERPEGLGDDVLVDVMGRNEKLWVTSDNFMTVDKWTWSNLELFRIVDDRYKPKHHIPDAGKKIESDWFERGELPPVGERVVRAHNGDTVKVLAHGTAGVICVKDEEDYLYLLARCDNDFLPLKTKRDEVIEEAYKIADLSTSWKESLRKLYDAGMLKKQENKYE